MTERAQRALALIRENRPAPAPAPPVEGEHADTDNIIAYLTWWEERENLVEQHLT